MPSTALNRLLLRLLPTARFPRADEEAFAHAAMLMLWALAASTLTLIAAMVEFAFGGSGGPLLLVAAALVLAEMLYFRDRGSLRSAAHVIVATQLLAIAGMLLVSGGRMVGMALILPLFVFMVAVLLPRRYTVLWGSVAIACIVFSGYLKQHWAAPWIQPDDAWVASAPYRVPVFSTLLAALAGLAFTGVYRALIQRIAEGRARERGMAERAQAQEHRIRAIADNLPALISYVDSGERFRFVNGARAWPAQAIDDAPLGRALRELLGETSYAAIHAQVDAALRGERVTFAFSTAQGDRVAHHRAHFVPDQPVDGQVRGFYSMVFDITEQTASELRANASERRMRLIADNVPVAISYIDDGERYRFNNLMYERWFRRPDAQITHQLLSEVLGERNYSRIRPPLQRALRGETVEFEVELERDGMPRRQRGRYTPDVDADGRVLGVIGMVQDVTELVRLQDDLVRQAHYDALTGLANRYLLYELLNRALQRFEHTGSRLAVLYLDLDRFKSINDTFGHAAGDAVLCEFASRIVGCKRAGDVAARLSGDEFVLLIEHLESPEVATQLALRVAAVMEPPFSINDHDLMVGVSIGMAIVEAGDDADELLKRADRALYADKARRAASGAGSVRLVSGS
jgi:diguanylate cyclase (GGDEF)-like protein/PAS domain S-box-containing protein